MTHLPRPDSTCLVLPPRHDGRSVKRPASSCLHPPTRGGGDRRQVTPPHLTTGTRITTDLPPQRDSSGGLFSSMLRHAARATIAGAEPRAVVLAPPSWSRATSLALSDRRGGLRVASWLRRAGSVSGQLDGQAVICGRHECKPGANRAASLQVRGLHADKESAGNGVAGAS